MNLEALDAVYRSAVLSLNAANEAVNYADSALKKAREAQAKANESVNALGKLISEASK